MYPLIVLCCAGPYMLQPFGHHRTQFLPSALLRHGLLFVLLSSVFQASWTTGLWVTPVPAPHFAVGVLGLRCILPHSAFYMF